MEIRRATHSDLGSLMEVFEGAKQIMRASGNLHQWNDGYPSEDIVLQDIEAGNCYVACKKSSGAILGTMALIEGPDPTYSVIDGAWPDEKPYYVIHRIAVAAPGQDLARKMFDWAYSQISPKGYETIRIDTHRDNCIMKHVLTKYGFTECGVIRLSNGDPRDAYHL